MSLRCSNPYSTIFLSFLSCRSKKRKTKLERDEKKPSGLERERMIPGQVPSIQLSVSSAGMLKSARVVWMPLQAAAKSPKKKTPEKQQLPKTELGRSRVGATCFPRPQTSKACDHSELLQQLGWAGAGFRIGIWGCAVPQGLCSPRSVEKLGGIKRMQTLTEWCSQEQHLIP